jgi:hypothetical protein
MGLDNYAMSVRPPEDWTDPDQDLYLAPEAEAAFSAEQAEIERRHDFCVFEGSYFRGKLYWEIIEDITGVHIGQEWIPPETVRMMADKLAQCGPPEFYLWVLKETREWEPCTPQELADLTVFFRVCAEHGLGLVGS